MSDLELNVRLAMESQSFQQQITALNRQMSVVQSEFAAASSSLEGFGSSQDRLRAQSASLSQQLDLGRQRVTTLTEAQARARTVLETNATANEQLRQRVAAATEAYNASVAATGAASVESQTLETELRQLNAEYAASNNTLAGNARALDNLTTRTNNAQVQANRLESELADVTRELRIQEAGWRDLSERMAATSESIKSAGEKLSSVGETLTKGITLPLVGIGVAAAKVGMDFDAAMSRVKAISGATSTEFDNLREQALQLGADTAFSAGEAAQGMEDLASAGFTVSEIMVAMPGMLDLAASGGLGVGEAADIAGSALRGFGLEADQAGHVADVLAKAAGDTNADVQGLGRALKYAAPPAKALGMSLEEVSASVGILSNAGIKGESAGTMLRSSLISLASPSKEASKLMSDLGFNAFDSQGKMLPFSEVIGKLQQATKNLSDEKRADALATMFGKEALSGMMVLMEAGPNTLDELTKSFQGSDGAAKAMAETMMDNAKSAVEEMMGSLETAGIRIETILAPIITQFANKIGELVDKFSELSPETQKTILVVAGLAAAIGPVIGIIGALVSAVGSVFLAISTVSGAIAVVATGAAAATPAIATLAGAFTILTGPIGLTIAALSGMALGVGLLVNHLRKDAIPATDLFGDTTSDATKKAVGAYVDLDDKATKSLMSLNFSGKEVSKETADGLIKNFSEMGTQIKSGLDKHYGESLNTMKDFFANSSTLTEAEEAAALALMAKNNEDKKKSVDDGEKQIKEILDRASAAKRALNSEEQAEINYIQETMKQNAVKVLSETELESKSILERMKAQAGEITAQQAAEVVKNSLEQKDKAVANANEQYDKTVKEIIKQRDETGAITKEQADALIKEAGRQRDDSVTAATEMNNKVVEQAKLQATEHVNQVDWTTGEVKSKWQAMKDDTAQKMADIKTDLETKWSELKTDIARKMADIKSDAIAKWNEIKAEIPPIVEDLKIAVSSKFDEIATKVTDIWEGVKTTIKDAINSVIDTINGFISHVNSIRINVPTISIPFVGTFGGYSIGMPQIPSIPKLAAGGIVTRETLALVGEAGPEAVIPLKELEKMVLKIASGSKSNGSIVQHITVHSPTPLTPAETARQIKNASRQLALEW